MLSTIRSESSCSLNSSRSLAGFSLRRQLILAFFCGHCVPHISFRPYSTIHILQGRGVEQPDVTAVSPSRHPHANESLPFRMATSLVVFTASCGAKDKHTYPNLAVTLPPSQDPVSAAALFSNDRSGLPWCPTVIDKCRPCLYHRH